MNRKTLAVPFFVLLVFTLLLSACGAPATPTAVPESVGQGDSQVGGGAPGIAVQGNQNPAAGEMQAAAPQVKEAEAAMPAVPAPGEYPGSPEGVVQAYLASYSDQPGQMDSYLSQGQAGDSASLLGFEGSLEGFVIDAAAVNPDPPAAVVSAAVKVGGAEIRRTFTLGQENGQWKIELIANEVN